MENIYRIISDDQQDAEAKYIIVFVAIEEDGLSGAQLPDSLKKIKSLKNISAWWNIQYSTAQVMDQFNKINQFLKDLPIV